MDNFFESNGFEFFASDWGYDSDFRGEQFYFDVDAIKIKDRGLIIDWYGIEEATKLLLNPEQWVSDNLFDWVKSRFDNQEPDYSDLDQDADFCAGAWR